MSFLEKKETTTKLFWESPFLHNELTLLFNQTFD